MSPPDVVDRVVPATHGRRENKSAPIFERDLPAFLKEQYGEQGLKNLYGRFRHGEDPVDGLKRRSFLRASCRGFGQGVSVEPGATFLHTERIEIGAGVFIGRGCAIQGRYDGHCRIGSGCWLGPGRFLDARDLELEEWVGAGPGVSILGSVHRETPVDQPLIRNDLIVRPVRIGAGGDVGVNAVILPGATIGQGAILGAGTVVTENVPELTGVTGVPAKPLRLRHGDAIPRMDSPSC